MLGLQRVEGGEREFGGHRERRRGVDLVESLRLQLGDEGLSAGEAVGGHGDADA